MSRFVLKNYLKDYKFVCDIELNFCQIPYNNLFDRLIRNIELQELSQDMSQYNETSTPAVCDSCLGSNPYVQMTREINGLQCKTCTRPFTVFRWKSETRGKGSFKRTNICLTCARARNCCQCCMLDLALGIDLITRDQLHKLAKAKSSHKELDLDSKQLVTAANETSKIYYADQLEKKFSRQDSEHMEDDLKSKEEEARDLLMRIEDKRTDGLTSNEDNKNKKRRIDHEKNSKDDVKLSPAEILKLCKELPFNGSLTKLPTSKTLRSFFIFGITEKLADYMVKDYFSELGGIVDSMYLNHKAKFGFINFSTRSNAEKVANSIIESQKLRLKLPEKDTYDYPSLVVIQNIPLRVCWGKTVSVTFSNIEMYKVSQIVTKQLTKFSMKDQQLKFNTVSVEGTTKKSKKKMKTQKDSSSYSNDSLPITGNDSKIQYKSLTNLEL